MPPPEAVTFEEPVTFSAVALLEFTYTPQLEELSVEVPVTLRAAAAVASRTYTQDADGRLLRPAIDCAVIAAVENPAAKRKLFGEVVDTVALIHRDGLLPVTPGGAVLFSIMVAVMEGGPSIVA